MADEIAYDRALWFFQEVVEPFVEEFLRDPASMRLGCVACIVLDSMVDHYFHARPIEGAATNPERLRAALSANWAFRQVSAVANAMKHVKPDRRTDRSGFEKVETWRIDLGNFRAGWPMSGDEVMVDVAPSGSWPLPQLVKAAEEMWRGKLNLTAGFAMLARRLLW
jgi:hypothetical protein